MATGYCDAQAEDLGWSVEIEPLRALARTWLVLPPFTVDLRLLGASHQAAVWIAGPAGAGGTDAVRCADHDCADHHCADHRSTERGALLCRETVACLPGRTTPLPEAAVCDLAGWRYTIESAVRTLPRADFAARLARIERRSAQWPGIAGRYPGTPGAITAIAVRLWAGGLRWLTWHTYPQQGMIATTLSCLQVCQ
ncbi:MAG TPA: DUF2617 family protein [Actinocrinis sp.]